MQREDEVLRRDFASSQLVIHPATNRVDRVKEQTAGVEQGKLKRKATNALPLVILHALWVERERPGEKV